jgi:hypothetical protein
VNETSLCRSPYIPSSGIITLQNMRWMRRSDLRMLIEHHTQKIRAGTLRSNELNSVFHWETRRYKFHRRAFYRTGTHAGRATR